MIFIYRRKFRSQTSDNMDRWKAEMGRVREKRRVEERRAEERRSEKRKSQKKEDAGARKGRKVAKHSVFPMICGSGGSKSRLAKAAGAEPSGQMRDEKLHADVAPSTFSSQMYKTPHARTTFGSCDVEKCTPLWRESEKVKNTSRSDHFWKLRCLKSARRCGAKHISKSKCTKHTRFRPLLEVAMSKKCMRLWRKAHFEVKMFKTPHVRTTLGSCDVEKVHAVVARSTFRSQDGKNTTCSRHFWTFRCRFAWQAQGIVHLVKSEEKREGFVPFSTTTTTTSHYTPIHYTTTTTRPSQHSTTLNYTQLHSIALHYITLHYTPLHYTTQRYTTLHYTPLHYTTLHLTTLHSTTLQYTTLNYTTLHYTTRHYTTLHLQLHLQLQRQLQYIT